jgi:hypothetical protein
MNPIKIKIQETLDDDFLKRYMTPTIAGTNWADANIGYASATDVENASSPCISSYAATIEGIKNEKDKAIAKNHTFRFIDFSVGI